MAAEIQTLGESQQLLKGRMSNVHTAAQGALEREDRAVVKFGDHNQGSQVGKNYGTNHGGTYNYSK